VVARSKTTRRREPKLPPVRVRNAAESRAFIEARERLGIGGDELARKLREGAFENPDQRDRIGIALLLGLA